MQIIYSFGNYSQEQAYEKIDSFLDGLVSQYSDMISILQRNGILRRIKWILDLKLKDTI
jgi:hypothetical protein